MGARIPQEYGMNTQNKRQPAKTAPFAYAMKTQPSTYKVGGKCAGPGICSGGNMNTGGKRRPSKDLNSKID